MGKKLIDELESIDDATRTVGQRVASDLRSQIDRTASEAATQYAYYLDHNGLFPIALEALKLFQQEIQSVFDIRDGYRLDRHAADSASA